MDGEAQNFLQVGKVTGNKSGTKVAVEFVAMFHSHFDIYSSMNMQAPL